MVFSPKKIFFVLILFLVAIFTFAGCNAGDFGNKHVSTELDPGFAEKQEPLQKEYGATLEKIKEPIEEKGLDQDAPQKGTGEVLAPDKFFVPAAPLGQKENPEIKAKGIYVTANSAGLEQRFQDFMDMVDETELNAMVIDVKNDHGVMAYPSQIEIVKEVMEDHFEPVRDIRDLLLRLEEKNIYPIARIVVFRDPYLSQFYPEWFIQKRDGGVWADRKGFTWANPYQKKVWDYNVSIAKEAALMGFREIQFDYVRFPEDAENFDLQVVLPAEEELAKDEVIRDFLVYAQEQLKDYNVYVSADVFGVIATYITDKDGIGQSWEEITAVVDYIYPMVYPSHYGPGFFGLSVPDAKPRETILRAMEDAVKRNATVKNPAPIRPWLQGFTATWINGNITYGPSQIREQIDAALELGIEEFFIWNARNQYDVRSFLSEEEALEKQKKARSYREDMGLDHIHQTKLETFKQYLGHISEQNWVKVYPYHANDFKMDRNQFFKWAQSWTFDHLEFDILEDDVLSNIFYQADITLSHGDKKIVLREETFEIFMENSIWKVRPPEVFLEALSGSY